MAERSIFWNTGTSGDGTSPISQDFTNQFFGAIFTRGGVTAAAPATAAGVFPGVGNELAVTSGTGQVQVATGMGMDAGFAYVNDSALNIAVPTPVGNTRIDRLVLRANYSARTVRMTRIAGTEGTGSPPALTQTAGTTWDIPIAAITVTVAGAITVADQRTFNRFATRLDRSDIAGGADGRVPYYDPSGRLTDEANLSYDATNDRLAVGGAGLRGRLSLRGTLGKASATYEPIFSMASSDAVAPIELVAAFQGGSPPYAIVEVTDGIVKYDLALMLFGGRVGIGKTPAYALDVAGQVGINPAVAAAPLVLSTNGQDQRVTRLRADANSTLRINRQGGSATAWGSVGATNYFTNGIPQINGQARIQVGTAAINWPGGSQQSNTTTVTFPEPYSQIPILVCTGFRLGAIPPDGAPFITALSATQFSVQMWCFTGSPGTGNASTCNWIAIGPE